MAPGRIGLSAAAGVAPVLGAGTTGVVVAVDVCAPEEEPEHAASSSATDASASATLLENDRIQEPRLL